MKKVICLLLATTMAIGLVACKAGEAVEAAPTPVSTPEPTPVVITNVDYVIEREGNPTTGYDWNVTIEDSSILSVAVSHGDDKEQASVTLTSSTPELTTEAAAEPVDDVVGEVAPEVAAEATADENVESAIVGAPSTYKFVFSPIKEGSTVVRLDYKRAWEDTEYDIHEKYNVTVALRDYKLEITMDPVEEKIGKIETYTLYGAEANGVSVSLKDMVVADIDVTKSFIKLDRYNKKAMINIEYADGVNSLECTINEENMVMVAEDTSSLVYTFDGDTLVIPAANGGKLIFAPEEKVQTEIADIKEQMTKATYHMVSYKFKKKTYTLENMAETGVDITPFYIMFKNDFTGELLVNDHDMITFTWEPGTMILSDGNNTRVSFTVSEDNNVSFSYLKADYVFALNEDTILDLSNLRTDR